MSIKTTGQAGEYAVAAELCRRKMVATTFTRNMPGFDILTLNPKSNKSCRVQVKTVEKGEWTIKAEKHLLFDTKKFENGIQEITGLTKANDTDFFVFVKLNIKEKDGFYILPKKDLELIVEKNYSRMLKEKSGRRPKNPKSTHSAIHIHHIESYKDNWEIIINNLK